MSRDLFRLFGNGNQAAEGKSATAPQNLFDMTNDDGEQDALLKKAEKSLETSLRVDYSDFANHVFLNSALSYFDITGEKILSEYPKDGSRGELEAFTNDLDGYQKYILNNWPVRSGHIVFKPSVSSSYVQIDDVGNFDNVTKNGMLSPGTGSWALEMWYNSARTLTASQGISVLAQKDDRVGVSLTLYLSGSSVYLNLKSGSSTTEVSAPAHINTSGYVLGVVDRSLVSGTLTIYTGSQSKFPTVVSSASISFGGALTLASASLFIGSGTLTSKNHVPYSGTVDEVRVWNCALALADVTSSFNRKIYSNKNLVGMWRFNETGSTGLSGVDSIVADTSGHMVNGRIKNYWNGARGSGSFVYETPDIICDVRCAEVLSFIVEQRTSGSDYDRNNSGKITDMFPQELLRGQEEQEHDIIKNFLYVMGRYFDKIRLYAQHLQYSLRASECTSNDVPDSKLEDLARFFGIELPGSFSDTSALQYLIGRDIKPGELGNYELDVKLDEIKKKIWRRLLSNLSTIYKKKGTRDSVNAVMNAHGIPSNIFRLKEYGYLEKSAIREERIPSQITTRNVFINSTDTLQIKMSQSYTDFTIEGRLKLHQSTGAQQDMIIFEHPVTGQASGYISAYQQGAGSTTGALYFFAQSGEFVGVTGPIFNDEWFNFSVVKKSLSSDLSNFKIEVNRFKENRIYYSASYEEQLADVQTYQTTDPQFYCSTQQNSYSLDEFRFWTRALEQNELEDHCLNFRSFGSNYPLNLKNDLIVHLRCDETFTSGAFTVLLDHSMHGHNAICSGTQVSGTEYLNEYSYMASPDLGWTDEKVRVFSDEINEEDRPRDIPVLSLEMNMIDQLNEDISQMMSSIDTINDAIGHPTSQYRSTYDSLDKLKKEYFRRMTDKLNFRIFIDALDFFDRSFIDVIKKLIPAKARFFGGETVIESHTFERSKTQYAPPADDNVVDSIISCTINVFRR